MSDPFASYQKSLGSGAVQHYQLAADADNDLDPRPRAIRCNEAGTITLRDETGTDLPYAMEAGEMLSVRAVRVTAIASGVFYALL